MHTFYAKIFNKRLECTTFEVKKCKMRKDGKFYRL